MDNVGRVESVRSEICIVSGLRNVGLNNVVTFSSGGKGIVFGFDRTTAQVIMFKDYEQLKKGDLVRISDETVVTYASDKLLGRVIDPLGNPVDGRGALDESEAKRMDIEPIARPIYQRTFVDKAFNTGITMIDSQIPIGKGQRELLLGERNTGQNDLATSVIVNQSKLQTGVICIYVAIDAESASMKRRINRLIKEDAMKNTVVIFGRTASAATLNYIAPMVGVSIAEWFSAKGHNVLVVFDDLTRHAKVYRQLSLLLNRPASREAYPGDIFYLHSRLLERCGAFNDFGGNGTITALPIVETPTEEATDFITTNLMSITDGHVLFRQMLANKGIQPPIDSGFSVSRIGGRVQPRLLRELSESLKEIIIHFSEVERFLAFGSDLNAESLELYELGRRAYAVFDQTPDDCRTTMEETMLIYFVMSRQALQWDISQMPDVIEQLLEFMKTSPYDNMLNQSLLDSSVSQAKMTLDECLHDFVIAPKTIRPQQKEKRLIAETETISSILREGDEMFHDKD